jgi:hypothetical protein
VVEREVRDRIRELRRVKASELVSNPKNWRRHPKEQSAAMRGLLNEIGYAGALLARYSQRISCNVSATALRLILATSL